ncbi:hypothetical protein Cch01nite_13800 [Cellulomonas chitinilytica]|uniref:Uncharacterized protein n=1 Tax=Cellulomonas chitinilytica TaxID=398759 RepID=A0A919P2W5_9CELL|nr:hypothetical protein [Cellulomonas chitinilytica]GIG20656.1 hypothetical protein Cch01nite_13800 [Cellulomonas chitinilytica]
MQITEVFHPSPAGRMGGSCAIGSWQDAERAAEIFMRTHLGYWDAHVTNQGADAGTPATAYAEQVGIALFSYDAQGTFWACSSTARRLLADARANRTDSTRPPAERPTGDEARALVREMWGRRERERERARVEMVNRRSTELGSRADEPAGEA